jgi:ADP-ribosylarginine hydrolase
MVLAGVGDAMGYKSGQWEFCASTSKIIKDLNEITNNKGVLFLNCKNWMVSDDTVELLATAEGLIKAFKANKKSTFDDVMKSIAR